MGKRQQWVRTTVSCCLTWSSEGIIFRHGSSKMNNSPDPWGRRKPKVMLCWEEQRPRCAHYRRPSISISLGERVPSHPPAAASDVSQQNLELTLADYTLICPGIGLRVGSHFVSYMLQPKAKIMFLSNLLTSSYFTFLPRG